MQGALGGVQCWLSEKMKIRTKKINLNPPSQRSVLSLRQPGRSTKLTPYLGF